MVIDVGNKKEIKLLYVIREEYPTFRPDICALFGKYLPYLGIYTSIVAKCSKIKPDWSGGRVFCSNNSQIGMFFSLIRNAREYDAIQVRDKIIFAFFATIYSKIIHRPFFYWISYPFVEDDKEKYRYMRGSSPLWKRLFYLFRGHLQQYLFYHIVARYSTHIFVQSDEMKRWLNKRDGISQDKMTIVPMGIDFDEIDNIVKSDPINEPASLVVAYLGVINKLRMNEVFFDAMENVLECVPEVKLLFIGGGQEIGDDKWLADELNYRGLRERYEITGWLSRKDALKILTNASVGISVLRRHKLLDVSSPTKAMEYAALGIPSVVTDIPDQEHIINQIECGLSVPYEADAISAAVITLLRDEQMRDSFSKNGRERIRQIRGYHVIAENLANIYRSLLH